MQRVILGSLSFLLMSTAIAPALRAQTTAVNPTTLGSTPNYINQTTPFNLAYLAYRGYFKEQGIPSYDALIMAYRTGQISVEDIVQSAVKANRVSDRVLTDQNYLNAVEALLDDIQSEH